MKQNGLPFLRPYLARNARASSTPVRSTYLRLYASASSTPSSGEGKSSSEKGLGGSGTAPKWPYPRIVQDSRAMTCNAFRERYSSIETPEETHQDDVVTIRGRISSIRTAGSKLVFFDIQQDGVKTQCMASLKPVLAPGFDKDEFRGFYNALRRGDTISVTGTPYRASRGELTVRVSELPQRLVSTLHDLPTELVDPETRIQNRHVDLLVNEQTSNTLRLRSHIIQYLRNFFLSDDFLEVQTPILADGAGGAVARSFTTRATEFQDKELALRIAPELWLKRLVVGGFDRVFEIGPSFRNEGLDATHNPEFTTCEFYKSYADIEELITMTETLFSGLATCVQNLKKERFSSLEQLDLDFTGPFKRLPFIPSIESAMSRSLPDLASPDALSAMTSLFESLSIPLPTNPTLPRLLDKLSAIYLEPLCKETPTFITHHPECLSPLSKSFMDPATKQRISARVELFVQGRELVNAYEEENSPIEQRRKFLDQTQHKGNVEEDGMSVDESYLETLEWGLPPTGGWGCGIDRVVMLFTGAKRIGDVLNFGNLRNVVGLAAAAKERKRRQELQQAQKP